MNRDLNKGTSQTSVCDLRRGCLTLSLVLLSQGLSHGHFCNVAQATLCKYISQQIDGCTWNWESLLLSGCDVEPCSELCMSDGKSAQARVTLEKASRKMALGLGLEQFHVSSWDDIQANNYRQRPRNLNTELWRA